MTSSYPMTTTLEPTTTPYPTTTLEPKSKFTPSMANYLTTILDPVTSPYNITTPEPTTNARKTTPYQETTTASKITSYITTILDPITTPYATTTAQPTNAEVTYGPITTYGTQTTYPQETMPPLDDLLLDATLPPLDDLLLDATLPPLDDLLLDATLPPLDDIVDPEMSFGPATTTLKPRIAAPQIKATSVRITAVTKGPLIATTRKQAITTPPKINTATLPPGQKNFPPIPAVYSNYPRYNFPNLKSKPKDGVFSIEDDGTAYETPFIAVFNDGTWIVVSATQNNAESFGLIEGAEVIFSGNDPFPDAKSPITPVAQPAAPEKYGSNKITCAPSANRALIATTKPVVTERSVQQNKSSVLYVSDCVGYPISSAFFKNGSLIITLDTNDDSTLYSGYYKLAL